MNLLNLKCESCGGDLILKDPNTRLYECDSCDVTMHLDANHSANIYNASLSNEMIKQQLEKAQTVLYDLKDYGMAYCLFRDLDTYIPNNIKVVEGLILSISHNFDFESVKEHFGSFNPECVYYLNRYRIIQKNTNEIYNFDEKYKKLYQEYKSYKSMLLFCKVVVFLICFGILYLIIQSFIGG
jgi:transposase